MEIFKTPAGTNVRVVLVDGEPWFVAADVCAVLGIGNPRQAVTYLDDDEVGQAPVTTNDGSGRALVTNIVAEAGLFSLILRSRKPEARAFKRWITHEVLPAIRKAGRYEAAPQPELDDLEVARRYVAALEAKKALEATVAELAPSAAAWDHLASGDGDWAAADAAKILSRDPAIQLGQVRLFKQLAEWGWIYRAGDGKWRAKQSQIECGRLSEIPQSHYHPRNGDLVLDPPQVRIKPKGLVEIHKRLGGTASLAMQQQLAIRGT
jgi:anti-repressor protein